MSEIGDKMLRAEVFAQGMMLEALASLHPDPAALRRAFDYYTNSMIAELLNSPNSDETTNRAIQMHCERLARHIGTAQSRRTPPSTSVPPG